MSEDLNDPRRFLLNAHAAGLQAVDPRRSTAEALLADMPTENSIHLIAIGKAAPGMCAGAIDVLKARVRRALAVAPEHSTVSLAGVEMIHAGHPLPDERSLSAGRRLQQEIAASDCELVLLLVSGGGSAMVDVPAEPLLDEELIEIHRELYSMGFDIQQLNAVRQRLSAVKAGGLLDALPVNVECRQLLISDVPGDDISAIASGPGVPLREPPALPDLPDRVVEILPRWKPRIGKAISTTVVASNAKYLDAVEKFAAGQGIDIRWRGKLGGDAAGAARRCVAALLEGEAGLYLWGGETTVRLPENPPLGGRNQHLALAAAMEMAGRKDIRLLAAGTDGIDGNTEDAGAVVDGGTIERGELSGLNAVDCLRGFRSHEFLAGSGDLLYTGPSGTNVMDIVLAIRE